MKQENLKQEDFISLNSELTEFSLQKLEQRLETDPLAVGGLLDIISSGNMADAFYSAECSGTYCSGSVECNIH